MGRFASAKRLTTSGGAGNRVLQIQDGAELSLKYFGSGSTDPCSTRYPAAAPHRTRRASQPQIYAVQVREQRNRRAFPCVGWVQEARAFPASSPCSVTPAVLPTYSGCSPILLQDHVQLDRLCQGLALLTCFLCRSSVLDPLS